MPDGPLGRVSLQAAGIGEVFEENLNVVEVIERALENLAALAEGDPLFAPKRPPQAVEGVVEAAPQPGRRGLWPEGKSYLLLGTALSVGEQIVEKLAGFWIQSGESRGCPSRSTRVWPNAKIRTTAFRTASGSASSLSSRGVFACSIARPMARSLDMALPSVLALTKDA